MTVLQQQYYVALGVKSPEEIDEKKYGAIILSAFGAHMVLADGKIEQEEIDYVEEIGMQLSEHFDRIDFREYCNYPESVPSLEDLLNWSLDLDIVAKEGIYAYLNAIAKADDETSPEEKKILKMVKDQLGLESTDV